MRRGLGRLLVLGLCASLANCTVTGSKGLAPEVRGTATRPQLSDAQAEAYTRQRVLAAAGPAGALVADGWDPLADAVITGHRLPSLHYRVDPAAADGHKVFATVQAAVNQAHGDVASGRQPARRVFIGIAAGDYDELVYVPAGAVPITLWGLGADPAAVHIHQTLDARMPTAEYVARHHAVYSAAGMHPDIAALYRSCQQQPTLTTGCTAVMWVRRDGVQLRNLTVANHYDQGRGGAPRQASGQHQAVALKSEGADRLHLEQVHLLGHQDTLYLAGTAPDRTVRSFIHRSVVAGDIDFIFGPTTAYVLSSEIRWVGSLRGLASGTIAAPSTNLNIPYGLVFDDCDFTSAGGGPDMPAGVSLARQWFTGATCSPYGQQAERCEIAPPGSVHRARAISQATLEAVGKMVVLRSRLGAHLRPAEPWAPWQTDRAARNHRPVQYSSEDFWRLLQAAGENPAARGYRRAVPPEPYLAEYRNTGPGSAAAPP